MNGGGEERLSVIIPAFNVRDWLSGTLESVLSQDPGPSEVIVVDDGSTDGSGEAAAKFGPPVEVRTQSNRGLSAARNAGARAASGDLLFFLDADDRLVPGATSAALRALRAQPSAGICVPNHRRGPVGPLAWSVDPAARLVTRGDLAQLMRKNWLLSNALVRRDVWERHPYDEELSAVEDLDLYVRVLLDGIPILVLGYEGIVMAVRRSGSLTSRTRLMRTSRATVFRKLSRDGRLSLSERAIARWQVLKTTLGAALAPAEVAVGTRDLSASVLHVRLDESGGAAGHIDLIRVKLDKRYRFSEVKLDPRTLRMRPDGWIRGMRAVKEAMADARVIHVHGIRAAAVVAPLARVVRTRHFVVTVHGLHSLRRARHAPTLVVGLANRAVLSSFDRVIALSRSDHETIVRRKLAPEERVRLVNPGIEPRVRERSPSDRHEANGATVLWVGRFVEQKDPLAFVRTARRLAELDVDWLMAGDGPLLEAARRIAPPNLRFLGWVDDVNDLLARGDLVVSTSRWEGLPLILLEAAAAKKPVVATDVPGNRDIAIEGVPIRLVPSGNDDALADAIADLLADDLSRRELGERTGRVARNVFNADRMASEMDAIYGGLVG